MNFTPLYKIATRIVRKCQSLIGMSTLGARAIVVNTKQNIIGKTHLPTTLVHPWRRC